MRTTGLFRLGLAVYACLAAVALGAAWVSAEPPAGARQAAPTLQTRIVSVRQLVPTAPAAGANDPGALVPGTESELLLEHLCVLRGNDDACIGVTSYDFTQSPVEILEATSDSASAQCGVDPLSHQARCAVHQAVGERYGLRLRIRIDPNARGSAAMKLSAQGNYTIEPDQLMFKLEPHVNVQIMQSPDPAPIFNGTGRAITESTLLVRNLGPSTLHDATVRETFSAQPLMKVALDEPSQQFCSGGGTAPFACTLGDLVPLQERRVRFKATLPDVVPTSESVGVVDVDGDIGALPPGTFQFIHFGQVYVGTLETPHEVGVLQQFDIPIRFRNATGAATAKAEAIPLKWKVTLAGGLQLTGVRGEWYGLRCTVLAHTVECETPDIASGCCSANSTLTVLAQQAGDYGVQLEWSTPAWGAGMQRYVIPAVDGGAAKRDAPAPRAATDPLQR